MMKTFPIIIILVLCQVARAFKMTADWETCDSGTIEVKLLNLRRTVIFVYEILEAPAVAPKTLSMKIQGEVTSNSVSVFHSGYDQTKSYIMYYEEWDLSNPPLLSLILNRCGLTLTADWNTCENGTIEVKLTKSLGSTVIVNYDILKTQAPAPINLSKRIEGGPTSDGLSVYHSGYHPYRSYVIYYKEQDVSNAPMLALYLFGCNFELTADWNTCDDGHIEVKLLNLRTTVIFAYEILEAPAVAPNTLSMKIEGEVTSNSVSVFHSGYDQTKSYIIYYEEWDISYPPLLSLILNRCPTSKGNIEQDPHMTTFDGVKYNFQGLCTYVLTQDCSNIHKPSFQVTADFRGKYSELRSKPLTRINAVDVYVDGMQLLRILKNDHFLIKGQLFTNSSAVISNGQGSVKVENEHVYVNLNNPALSLVWTKPTHGINIALNGPNMRGNVCGLLGNANGDPEDDFMKSDSVIVTKDDIYEFGDSWMVSGSCE